MPGQITTSKYAAPSMDRGTQRSTLCSPQCAQSGIKQTLREVDSSLTGVQVLPRGREATPAVPRGLHQQVLRSKARGWSRSSALIHCERGASAQPLL